MLKIRMDQNGIFDIFCCVYLLGFKARFYMFCSSNHHEFSFVPAELHLLNYLYVRLNDFNVAKVITTFYFT